jgi:transposase
VRLVSATARRHGISRSLLLCWRRALQVERADAGSVRGFVPAKIVSERLPERAPAAVTPATGRMEIVLNSFDPKAVDFAETDRAIRSVS